MIEYFYTRLDAPLQAFYLAETRAGFLHQSNPYRVAIQNLAENKNFFSAYAHGEKWERCMNTFWNCERSIGLMPLQLWPVITTDIDSTMFEIYALYVPLQERKNKNQVLQSL